MFYHTVIASALFWAVVCWGSGTTDKNCRRPDKLVNKVSSVLCERLDNLRTVVEHQIKRKLYVITDHNKHPLHDILTGQRSSCSKRLIRVCCRTEKFRRAFVTLSPYRTGTACTTL